MSVKEIGIILHGATGRIGATQHLANALAPIRAEGGMRSNSGCIMPRLLLVGRNATRLADIAHRHGVADWTGGWTAHGDVSESQRRCISQR